MLTGWGRSSFNVKALSYEQAVEVIRLLHFRDVTELEDDHPFISFESYEYLTETYTQVSLKENGGQATIEFIKDDSLKTTLFSNADNKLAEARHDTLKELAGSLAEKKMTDVFKMLPAEFKVKNNPGKYAEVYRERYNEYFESYMEQLSKL